MHWNAESVNNKRLELQHILHEKQVDICCIQETHLKKGMPFRVRGYRCEQFRHDREHTTKGGILTLVRNNINALPLDHHMADSEFQEIQVKTETADFNIVNFYGPDSQPLSLDSINMQATSKVIVGDFNSHSQSWGYDHMNSRGEEVENWQDDNRLILLNSPHDQPTFYSRAWRTTTTPDLAFCTEDMRNVKREVGDPLGGSDHRPVFLTLGLETTQSTLPRWNYKKAKWGLFSHRTSELTKDIRVQGRDINMVVREFNAGILKAAKETIPRGARKSYKPYWSTELQELEDNMTEARREAETNPSEQNNIKLQASKATFLRHKLQAQRRSWRDKTSSLNMEKDGRKLWRLTKQLNDESGGRGTVTLMEDGKVLTGKDAADKFADSYANESNIPIRPKQQREARREQRERQNTAPTVEPMTQQLVLHELKSALKTLKVRKAPGPDGISNEMLTHLGSAALKKLLEIFNSSWERGTLPQIWREAIMTPIHKSGKDPKRATSYRPISLTSCVVKTMERMVNKRLQWYLETKGILASEQAGFRSCRSTEDQVTYLSQEVEDAFQESKQTFVMWIDLQKAFDKVWTDGLLVKLLRAGVNSRMYSWIRTFLFNRRARVALDQTHSKKILLRHGVPQGGVISPTLFLLFINDLVEELPRGVKAALYADDLVMWCKEEYSTTATYRMQQAADKLNAWAEDWCVSISKEKSSTTLFTKSTVQKAGTIRLGDTTLKEEKVVTYLGVTFDKRQTWNPHIEKAVGKARRRLAILRKLAGTTWGANEKILKTVYQGMVRPHLEYGSTAWSTAAKTNLSKLDKVQNQALRIMTGAMKSTPIQEMEKTTCIQPLNQRREAKTLMQGMKFRCLPEHPMNERLNRYTKNRLSRRSFVHEVKRLERLHAEALPTEVTPLHPPDTWIQRQPSPFIQKSVQYVIPGEGQECAVKRAHTLAMIEECYPEEAWIHVYTDGSATQAVANGGAGILVKYPGGQSTTASFATGKHCTNYGAETKALLQAARIIQSSEDLCEQVVFFSDALSVLQALESDSLPQLSKEMAKVGETRRVTLQWIPAHCGIPGNERADELAKQGAHEDQPDNSVSYAEERSLIKALYNPWKERDDYCLLSRAQQVILIRLRTGHNRLNAHMSRKLKLALTSTCPCGTEDQTTEHVLQTCPLHREVRQQVWPTATSLRTKLYGNRQDLMDTTTFIQRCGLTV